MYGHIYGSTRSIVESATFRKGGKTLLSLSRLFNNLAPCAYFPAKPAGHSNYSYYHLLIAPSNYEQYDDIKDKEQTMNHGHGNELDRHPIYY